MIEQSIKEFKKAIEFSPEKHIYWENLKLLEAVKAGAQANIYFQQRKLALAAQEFRRSAKLWSPNAGGYKEVQENVRIIDRNIQASEANAKGMEFLKRRDFSAAAREFKRATGLSSPAYEPEKSQFRQRLAEAELGMKADKEIRAADKFMQRGRADQAAIYYERALMASPDDTVAKQGLQEAQRMMAAQEEGERHDGREASREAGTRNGDRPAAGSGRAAETGEPRHKIEFGQNKKALDQLISTNDAEREAAGTPSNTRRKERSGDPYDRGGKYSGSISTDAVDARNAGDGAEEKPLPPAVAKALEKDKEYQKLSTSREAAAKDVKAAQAGIEKLEKRISGASDADKAKLQVELVNLRDKKTAAKSKQAVVEVKMNDRKQKLISITQPEED
ncbi:MAG: hypothetical protein EPN97_18485 [Alphaproteobacteria bacterium]|nr:MAG: hypothetical protein EPN97_18485 [Alphaproteobacteria bacterium]